VAIKDSLVSGGRARPFFQRRRDRVFAGLNQCSECLASFLIARSGDQFSSNVQRKKHLHARAFYHLDVGEVCAFPSQPNDTIAEFSDLADGSQFV
jgi:hypothetical protein